MASADIPASEERQGRLDGPTVSLIPGQAGKPLTWVVSLLMCALWPTRTLPLQPTLWAAVQQPDKQAQ